MGSRGGLSTVVRCEAADMGFKGLLQWQERYVEVQRFGRLVLKMEEAILQRRSPCRSRLSEYHFMKKWP